MYTKIKHPGRNKAIIALEIVLVLSQTLAPTITMALTGGPSQPEVQSFEPVSTSEMVDLSTGDFVYNIPLIDVGGYPINLNYHAGISADQESSWVGLGWNINPGSLNRTMRGIPDDFNGTEVVHKYNVKENRTIGGVLNVAGEIFGAPIDVGIGAGINFNNYVGYGVEMDLDIGLNSSASQLESGSARLGISFNGGSNGLEISPNVSFSKQLQSKNTSFRFGSFLSFPMSSSEGLKSMNFGLNMTAQQLTNQTYRTLYKTSGSGSVFDFTTTSHFPVREFPRLNINNTYIGKIGGSLLGLYGSADFCGYLSSNKIVGNTFISNAYGYMYEQGANEHSLLDFNNEIEIAYTPSLPNLPLTNHTYDIFSATGQGLAGMFRAKRNDMSYVHNLKIESEGKGKSFGLEVGLGLGTHIGGNVLDNDSQSHVSLWEDENDALEFYRKNEDCQEPVYFESMGEKTPINEVHYNSVGADKPVAVQLSSGKLKPNFVGENFSSQISSNTERQKRNTSMTYLTVGEALSLNKQVEYPTYKDHIAEVTITKPTGERYVYGQAVYNTLQEDITFALGDVQGSSGATEDGIYSFGSELDLENRMDALYTNTNQSNIIAGRDNYYSAILTPGYSHSHLLTQVLSDDYVDVTGDGPSLDDLGSYTSFVYEKAVNNYKWRVPYETHQVNRNEGLLIDDEDDKGNISRGSKDLYYLKEIKTKTHYATFSLSDRKDGIEAHSPSVSSPRSLKVLDKIRLYSIKNELIKTVHFKYTYELCPGVNNNIHYGDDQVPDSEKGKLTLKEMYITYGSSSKGRLNSYKFEYGELNEFDVNESNHPYDSKSYDRWGGYSPRIVDPNSGLRSIEFPYVSQEIDEEGNFLADQYAKSWTLSKIKLPSGGQIDIELEADDYAYVENEKAMQMFKVFGSSKNKNSVNNMNDVTDRLYSGNNRYKYLWFKLIDQHKEYSNNEDFIDNYFSGLNSLLPNKNKLYFKFLVQLSENDDEQFIPGYANIIDAGYKNLNGVKCGYVKVDNHKYKGKQYHPISVAAWNFIRIQASNFAISSSQNLNLPSVSESNFLQLLEQFITNNLITQVINFAKGPFKTLKGKQSSKHFIPNKSWIRLESPNGQKKGGGARVASLSVNDNWLSDNDNKIYKTNYTYQMEDGSSSGVACYEPTIGGEENALRQPIVYSNNKYLVPDEDHMIEKPLGESFYPNPRVCYRKVTIKTAYSDDALQVNKVGHKEYAFYTAKEFPVFLSNTKINNSGNYTSNLLGRILKINFKQFTYASQGYAVEVNDMHGKLKSIKSFNDNNILLKSTEHHYLTQGFYSQDGVNKLKNRVLVGNNKQESSEKLMGLSYDVVSTFRESYNKIKNMGIAGNTDLIPVFFLPVPIFVPLPKYSKQTIKFKSSVVTKLIKRSGILKEVRTYDMGAQINTTNEMWDANTGEVILTSSQNDFNDDLYSLSLPAYWLYNGMGQASHNVRAQLAPDDVATNGAITNSSGNFEPGDELLLTHSDPIMGSEIAWVRDQNEYDLLDDNLYLINRAGETINDFESAFVMRSGKRNKLHESVFDIVALNNNPIQYFLPFRLSDEYWKYISRTLDHSLTLYKDTWDVNCHCDANQTYLLNPYVLGSRGNWRLYENRKHISPRYQYENHIDNSGHYRIGTPLHFTGLSMELTSNYSYFPLQNRITAYNNLGEQTENQDYAGNYSSAKFGYNSTKATALVQNAKYNDHWHMNFEEPVSCEEADASYHTSEFVIPLEEPYYGKRSHSGKNSAKVGPGGFILYNFKTK